MKSYRLLGAIIMAAAVLCVVPTLTVAAEKSLSLEKLPAAVRAAIQQHAGQSPISEIEMEEDNGQTVYEVELQQDGKETDLVFSAAGELLTQKAETRGDEGDDDKEGDNDGEGDDAEDGETAVAWGDLPKSVQAAFLDAMGSAKPGATMIEKEGGHTYYEAEYESEGKAHAIKATEEGVVVEHEQAVAVADLPAGIAERLNKAAGKAEITEAELVTITFYEITVKRGEKERELQILPNGQPIEIEDD